MSLVVHTAKIPSKLATMAHLQGTGWYRFPAEIRYMILGQILIESDTTLKLDDQSSTFRSNQRLGHLAGVCRDWQYVFERQTFRRLRLKGSDLPFFEQVVSNRPSILNHVQHMLLRIELPEYDCENRTCREPEDQATIKKNNRIFSSDIKYLLKILGSWDPETATAIGSESRGMTLEMVPVSPSDNQHAFYFPALEEEYPFLIAEDLTKKTSLLEYHREKAADTPTALQEQHHRRWRYSTLPMFAERLYGTPLKLLERKSSVLPKVPVVKGLLLRQSTCRSIHMRTLSQILQQSLIGLTWFRLEGRVNNDVGKCLEVAKAYISVLIPAMPVSLKRLYLSQIQPYQFCKPLFPVSYSRGLAKAIYSSPVLSRLSEFSAGSHVKEITFLNGLAGGFWGQGKFRKSMPPPPRWENLELLCLGSGIFGSHRHQHSRIQEVLQAAAKAALKLPKLRHMEVWGSSDEEVAHLFRYRIKHGDAAITWMCCESRQVRLAFQIIEMWREVASLRNAHQPLGVVEGLLPESTEEIKESEGQCIVKHLELKHLYLDPITLAQNEADEIIRLDSQNRP